MLLAVSSSRLLAQLPTNSFAVTSPCPGSPDQFSTLQSVLTTGALAPIGPVKDGANGIVVNALGYDAASPAVIYGLQSKPLNPMALLAGPSAAPTLYRIDLATAAATGLGAVAAPPVPATGLSAPGPTEIYMDEALVLDFVGDGDANSNYYLGGVTGRVFYNAVTKAYRLADVHMYVGVLPLAGLATAPAATVALAPAWHQVDLSDPASAALSTTYQRTGEAYLNSGGTTPIPDGGFQDWVYNTDQDNLVAYIGATNQLLTITAPAALPVAHTTAVAAPILDQAGAPGTQNIGAMFTDELHNVYAISAQGGTIYQIDHVTGNYSGKSYGAFGCSRGDAVSLPGAVPIALASFEAAPAETSVRLSWATTVEHNTASFGVQRSRTGTSAGWATVQTVAATGHAAGAAYAVTDAAPLLGLAYYRLALRYASGRIVYSPVLAVNYTRTALAGRSGSGTGTALDIFPNPVCGPAGLTLSAAGAPTSIDLLSATGQLVRHYPSATGGATRPLDVQGLPGGLYLLRVQQAGGMRTVHVTLAP